LLIDLGVTILAQQDDIFASIPVRWRTGGAAARPFLRISPDMRIIADARSLSKFILAKDLPSAFVATAARATDDKAPVGL
jgi:hypothetical protein